MNEPDNIIQFNPNPDFKPLTPEEHAACEAAGMFDEFDETFGQQEALNKENSSLFIVKVSNTQWVSFISSSMYIEDGREEFVEAAKSMCNQYPNNVYKSEQEARLDAETTQPNTFSSIVIFC